MNKIRKGHMILFITALIFIGFSYVVSIAANHLGDHYHPIIAMAVSECLLCIPFLIYAAVKKISVPRAIRMKKTRPINFLLAALVLLCAYPVVLVLNMISMIFVDNAVTDTMGALLTGYGPVLTLVTVAVLPGFAEEFLFRGVVYGSYAGYRALAGLIISAVFFGLMHGNFNQMPYAIFLGVVFVLMLEATDSIWITMFMHFLINGSNVLMMYLAGPVEYLVDAQTSMSVRGMFYSMILEDGFIVFLGVMIIFALMALFFAAATAALIYLTYQVNHRSAKQIFLGNSGRGEQAFHGPDGSMSAAKPRQKEKIFDFWMLGFILLMVGEMVLEMIVG